MSVKFLQWNPLYSENSEDCCALVTPCVAVYVVLKNGQLSSGLCTSILRVSATLLTIIWMPWYESGDGSAFTLLLQAFHPYVSINSVFTAHADNRWVICAPRSSSLQVAVTVGPGLGWVLSTLQSIFYLMIPCLSQLFNCTVPCWCFFHLEGFFFYQQNIEPMKIRGGFLFALFSFLWWPKCCPEVERYWGKFNVLSSFDNHGLKTEERRSRNGQVLCSLRETQNYSEMWDPDSIFVGNQFPGSSMAF